MKTLIFWGNTQRRSLATRSHKGLLNPTPLTACRPSNTTNRTGWRYSRQAPPLADTCNDALQPELPNPEGRHDRCGLRCCVRKERKGAVAAEGGLIHIHILYTTRYEQPHPPNPNSLFLTTSDRRRQFLHRYLYTSK